MSELEKIAKEYHNDCKEFMKKIARHRKRLCEICGRQKGCPAREGLAKMEEEVINTNFPELEQALLMSVKHISEEIILFVTMEMIRK